MTDLCSTHPSESATGRCATCSRPYCGLCLVEDVSRELAFCSESCRVAHRGPVSDLSEEFIAALRSPIRTGWSLAMQRLGGISLWVGVPLGAAYGVLRSLTHGDRWDDTTAVWGLHDVGMLVCMALGAAAIGVIVSNGYRRERSANPWPEVAQRILPWSLVWVLYFISVIAGTLLFIIPGLILGARLFWADEFVLIHRYSPISAIRESIHLTRGLTGRIIGFQMALSLAEFMMLILFGFGMVAVTAAAQSLEPGFLGTVLFSTLLSVLMAGLYATLHAPEVVYFYGLRAQRAQTSDDSIRVDSLRDSAPRKRSRGRTFAIVVGIFLLFGMLAIGAGYAWWQTQGPEFLAESQAAEAAGTEFGDSTDNQGCVAESVERFDRCEGGFGCNLRTNFFFGACLDASSPSDGFCDGVPPTDSFTESLGWSLAACELYGRSGSYCGSFSQQFQEYCHPQEAE